MKKTMSMLAVIGACFVLLSIPPAVSQMQSEAPQGGGATPQTSIPIDGDCESACCESAGGSVQEVSEGTNCVFNPDSPTTPAQVGQFIECAGGCE